ncbi:hypothetical protein [Halomicrococcus gelatinilyticus]|uniref:hypothetical protein n=1 Tax=Halomicrococcus gelatinilyticus TaxID=1702103 RepID=UPI002E1641FB
MRLQPTTLVAIGVVVGVVPALRFAVARNPAAWVALGGTFVLAGVGTALRRRRETTAATNASADSVHYLVCPECAARNYASRDACRLCGEQF